MLRLFLSITFPQQIVEQFQDIGFGVTSARWLPAEQTHCTVRFIGETPATKFDEICDRLDRIDHEQFELQPSGVGCFPLRGAPRILWVGLAPSPSLAALRKKIDRELRSAGVADERQKFHPHITIARLKEQATYASITPFLSQNNLFRTQSCPITEFHLFSSVLRPEGPQHQKEASFSLR